MHGEFFMKYRPLVPAALTLLAATSAHASGSAVLGKNRCLFRTQRSADFSTGQTVDGTGK
jgi:hypothetical protein